MSSWSELLLAVPNFSEGRDELVIADVVAAVASGGEVLDRHSDPIHNRTVVTLAGDEALAEGLGAAAGRCRELIDMRRHEGEHPCVGALDVAPAVYLRDEDRERAHLIAAQAGRRIGELGVPVFLYGELASEEPRRERSFFRRGGLAELVARMRSGELVADFGPAAPHPSAGATLVTARPPLAAFNVELDTGDVAVARAVAAELRESGGGLGGVRAIGVDLGDRAQVSTNVHDPVAVPLGAVIERVRALAARHGARPVAAEVVGLVPQAALRALPADVPLRGFEASRQVIENRLAGDRSE